MNLTVPAGSILGLIGPNGAEKTTCFHMISEALTPSVGTVTFLGQVISSNKPHVAAAHGLTRTFLKLRVFTSTDVVGNVYMGRDRKGSAGVLRGMLGLQSAEQSAHRAASYENLQSMKLTDAADGSASDLSFGRQRIMEVCRALAAEPALLRDEPMARPVRRGARGAGRTSAAATDRRTHDRARRARCGAGDVPRRPRRAAR